jgi:hypothetical protein
VKTILSLTLPLAVLLSGTAPASAWHHWAKVPVAPVYPVAGGGMAMSFSMQGDATAALMLLPILQRVFGGVAAIDPQLRPFVDLLQTLLPNPNALTATQARGMIEQMTNLNNQMGTLSKDLKDLTDNLKALRPALEKALLKGEMGGAAPALPSTDNLARTEIKQLLAEIAARQNARASSMATRSAPVNPRAEIKQLLAEIESRRLSKPQILVSRSN